MWKVVDGKIKFVPRVQPYRRPALEPRGTAPDVVEIITKKDIKGEADE